MIMIIFFPRYNIFKANLDKITKHNRGTSGYSMGMNEFGDMTAEEFHATHTGYNRVERDYIRSKNGPKHVRHVKNAATIDWRPTAVTPIKNQGQCGSCWAFSATGSMEGAWEIAKQSLVSLSEQQLMDCSSAQGNEGCEGGLMDQAFEYVISNGGITTEAQYPYTAQDGTCMQPLPPSAVTISSYVDVNPLDDGALETAVNIGPVSVAIEADQSSFQFYNGGIFNDSSCGTALDHGVLVVGYNTDATSGLNYWIVKNSWGTSWGLTGYIYMVREAGNGECGINMDPSYPVV